MLLRELASRIVIDHRKLTEYALNPESPRGRHKAVVFERVLGYTLSNWQHLHIQLKTLAPAVEAHPHSSDSYGRRYAANFLVTGVNGRQATVRTGWIVRSEENAVHLVTLWIEE